MSRRIAGMAALLLALVGSELTAQSILGRARDRARQSVTNRVNNGTDAAVDSALARGDRQIRCVFSDSVCVQRVQQAGRQVVLTDSSGTVLANQTLPPAGQAAPAPAPAPVAAPPASDAAPPATASAPPGAGAWLNYDFVPGNHVIWWEDFAGDDVGDFPRRMQLRDGNFEVVNIGGHRYLRTAEGGTVVIILPERLPQQFTVEARYFGPDGGNPLRFQTTFNGDAAVWGCYRTSGFVDGGTGNASSNSAVSDVAANDFVTCRFTISDRYIKAYLNEHRVANVPTTSVVRGDSLIITLPSTGDPQNPTLLSDLRIAAGGRRLYDALSASGRVATQGILFDTGSDRLRGESTPTLKEIGDMLTEHPALRLTIEGHTDNVGAAATNQALSERRAAAVRQYLLDTFHIDAARLVSAGFGASRPAAPNTTPEGRQTNRRVELVRN